MNAELVKSVALLVGVVGVLTITGISVYQGKTPKLSFMGVDLEFTDNE